MHLLIDMQGAQSAGSRNRGIGRYAKSLARALIQQMNISSDSITLLFSTSLGANDAFISELKSLKQVFSVRFWTPAFSEADLNGCDLPSQNANRISREATIEDINPDYVLMMSLFEGLGDSFTTFGPQGSSTIPTGFILYDLIPLIWDSIYLKDPQVREWYFSKLTEASKADHIFAISESSRQEGIENLGYNGGDITNISCDADEAFEVIPFIADRDSSLSRLGIDGNFILYTGGLDWRKNIEGLIWAYSGLPEYLQRDNSLVIVCSITHIQRKHIDEIIASAGVSSEKVILTGFITDDDLKLLYNCTSLFVFPSFHEGFGLPILEAMRCGAPCIGSRNSSIIEVLGNHRALFDPNNEIELCQLMQQVLTDAAFRNTLIEHTQLQQKLFSWKNSAEKLWSVLRAKNGLPKRSMPRRTLAMVAPFPPMTTGIATYSAVVAKALCRHYDITLICDGDVDPSIGITAVQNATWFLNNGHHFSHTIYQLGNSSFHSYMLPLLEKHPGIVVLHDVFLSGMYHDISTSTPQKNTFDDALYLSHGLLAAETTISAGSQMQATSAYPCSLDVVRRATSLVVHSEYAKKLLVEWFGETAIKGLAVIPLMRAHPPAISKAEARRKLRLSDEDYIGITLGSVYERKQSGRLFQAWCQSALAERSECLLIFVGEVDRSPFGKRFTKLIEALGPRFRVEITGRVSDEEYTAYMAAADFGVQLRKQSRGETSGAALDCVSFGLPTIVNDHGSLVEIPSDVVMHISEDFTDAELSEAMELLFSSEKLRKKFGQQAINYYWRILSPLSTVDRYIKVIEEGRKSIDSRIFDIEQDWINCAGAKAVELRKSLIHSLFQNIKVENRRPFTLVEVHHDDFSDEASISKLITTLKNFDQASVRFVHRTIDDELRLISASGLASAQPFRSSLPSLTVIRVQPGDTYVQTSIRCRADRMRNQISLAENSILHLAHNLTLSLERASDKELAIDIFSTFPTIIVNQGAAPAISDEISMAVLLRSKLFPIIEVYKSVNEKAELLEPVFVRLIRDMNPIWRFDPAHIEKHSQVGVRCKSKIITSSNAGFLLFGPWKPLRKGRYIYALFLEVRKCGIVIIDVTNQSIPLEKLEVAIEEGRSRDGTILIHIPLEILTDLENVEIRIATTEDVELSMLGVNLYKDGLTSQTSSGHNQTVIWGSPSTFDGSPSSIPIELLAFGPSSATEHMDQT